MLNCSIKMKHASARSNLRAFTLLEILIVVALVGLLAGLVVSNMDNIFGQSQAAMARLYVQDSLKTPLMRYRMDMGGYPSTAEGLASLVSAPNSGSGAGRWRGPYIETPGGRLPVDPWGEPYVYRYPGTKNPGGYDLFSKGPDKVAESDDDIGNW
ncbi:MAG: type II secretion system major pseudopilin GspG [Opitutae bacterium]|nr:type II secretion system major pseudopilin GspG [Opitutae bacterium]